ncbi:MAG: family 10 glycosylhydrolase [Bacteroidaceae bacterium]|nr:family 10 glycosylhydrolase [Bacteroidaceae bacterium]
MNMKYILSLISLLFLNLMPAKAQVAPLKYETRAVWLTTLNSLDWPKAPATSESGREQQKRELCKILDKYVELNINTVLLQTRVRGAVIYPSKIEGWDPCLTGEPGRNPGYDPLQFAIEECHKRGMELHCWMVTIPSGNAKVHAQLGNKSVTKTHPELCRRLKDYYYLDPGHPDTKHYLASICKEIVEKYDVDGIHFDFIRYPENAADAVDKVSYPKYGNGKNKSDWRRDNITACVREMYNTVKAIKPWVKVTSAPLGKYRDTSRFSAGGWNAYNAVYQDAKKWMKEGIMDGIFPMLYYRGDNFYPFILDWAENSNGRTVTAGLGIYFMHSSESKNPWPLADVKRQMNYSRLHGVGTAHFRSKFLTDYLKNLYNWCKEDFYATPSLIEPMTWMKSQKPNTPTGLTIDQENTFAKLSWNRVPDTSTGTYVTYNVYKSNSNPVDITNPKNLVAARLMATEVKIPTPLNADKNAYYAITCCNRFGVESDALQSVVKPQLSKIVYESETLHLPEMTGVKEILITDLAERPIFVIAYKPQINLPHLEDGCYIAYAVGKDGRKKRLGMFIK